MNNLNCTCGSSLKYIGNPTTLQMNFYIPKFQPGITLFYVCIDCGKGFKSELNFQDIGSPIPELEPRISSHKLDQAINGIIIDSIDSPTSKAFNICGYISYLQHPFMIWQLAPLFEIHSIKTINYNELVDNEPSEIETLFIPDKNENLANINKAINLIIEGQRLLSKGQTTILKSKDSLVSIICQNLKNKIMNEEV